MSMSNVYVLCILSGHKLSQMWQMCGARNVTLIVSLWCSRMMDREQQCQCSGLTPGPAWPAPALDIMTAELLPTLHRNVREDTGARNAALVWIRGMRDASRWGPSEGGNEWPSSVYWRGGGMWTMSVSSAWYKLIIPARKGHTITRSEDRIQRVIKCHQQDIKALHLAQMRLMLLSFIQRF